MQNKSGCVRAYYVGLRKVTGAGAAFRGRFIPVLLRGYLVQYVFCTVNGHCSVGAARIKGSCELIASVFLPSFYVAAAFFVVLFIQSSYDPVGPVSSHEASQKSIDCGSCEHKYR